MPTLTTDYVEAAAAQLRGLILDAAAAAMADGSLPAATLPDFAVEIPADTAHGDFAANLAMVSARVFHKAPGQIAAAIAAHLQLAGSHFDRAEVAGPGFLNFFLSRGWFAGILQEVARCGADYGRTGAGGGKKVMVEFVSANPTGPMHMGNARGGALGDCLAAALDWSGHDVTREFYVNDAGNQIQKFGLSLSTRYLQHFLGEEAAPLPEDAYQGADIIEHAQAFAAQHGDAFVRSDEETRRQALVDYALPLNIAKMKADMARYRIHYDVWFHESELHKNGDVLAAVDRLTARGHTYRSEDGTVWYRATDFGGEKDEVLVRANGIPTYLAADIAYHYNKFAARGFDTVINVWGADHHGHVARLKNAMDAIGLSGDRLEIVLMQMVRLMKDGEPFRMSKRTGKAISLTDLLDEVPVDAARFFFNLREPGSMVDFDLNLAVEQSTQNPVYYVQYAHARICSILRNVEAEGIRPRAVTAAELCRLSEPEEVELTRLIGRFPGEIAEAARVRDPARLTRFALDLATLFHKFYNAHRVKVEDEALLQARLALCIASRQVIANLLSLLSIDAPDSM